MKQKLFFKKLLSIIIAFVIITFGITNDALGAARQPPKAKTKEFKNTSGQPANDFHLQVLGAGSIVSANCPGFGANSTKTFPVPANQQAEQVKNVSWPASENVTPIAANGSVIITYNATSGLANFDLGDCYFTKDGVKVTTKAIDVNAGLKNNGANSGEVEFSNYDPLQSIVLTNIVVHVDNSVDPVSTGPYSPTGTLVGGIPSTITLAPGASQTYPFTFTNGAYFVSTHYTSALVSDPTDLFDESSSSEQVQSIPTLPQWGLILLAGLLLGGGILFMKTKLV